MPRLAFVASVVYTPDPLPHGVVLVEDDRITAVGSREALTIPTNATLIDAGDGFLAPGFIDIHVHGAGGRDLMDSTRDAHETVTRTLARFGTTSFYPTTVTAPQTDIFRSLEFLASCIDESAQTPTAAAQPLGIHMEGPYINLKRRGVHPIASIVEPTIEGYRRMAQASGGKLRIMTIAPELAASPQVMAEMIRDGVQPSIGHTDATYDETQRAVTLGARQATHVYNAMRPFANRDPGVLGAVLTDRRIRAELIADGVHVDPTSIRLLYAAKGDDGIVLVSDGISGTGMPDGVYPDAGFEVEVKDGVCRYQGALAGSVLTLDRAVRNMIAFLGIRPEQALAMATRNVAQLLGIADRKGVLQPGADADLLVLGPGLHLRAVYARGVAVRSGAEA